MDQVTWRSWKTRESIQRGGRNVLIEIQITLSLVQAFVELDQVVAGEKNCCCLVLWWSSGGARAWTESTNFQGSTQAYWKSTQLYRRVLCCSKW
jgi:hypothetical protein